MALTNITKFGLTRDLILNNGYNYIIGLDLGDGEVTASYMRLGGTMVDVKDVKLGQVGDGTRLLSGIYIYNDPNIPPVVGSLEQLSRYTEDRGHLYINFKVNPQRLNDNELFEGSKRTKKEIVKSFAHEVLKAIKQQNPDYDLSGRGILALGCPSSPEWLQTKRDLAYASIIKEAAEGTGLDLTVVVVPESRASLLKVYKERYTAEIRERMLKGVIVLDGGSSTFDVTYIDFNTNTQLDESIPLGASMIEKTILRKGLQDKGHTMGEITRALQARLDARSAKEAYYTDPALSPRILLELKNEDLIKVTCTKEFMDAVAETEQVKYSTEFDPSVKGSWSGLHRGFLEYCNRRIATITGKPSFEGIVMLTGGASQMRFMQVNTKEVFPSAKILLDTKASYCVSRGLSYAMYADLMAYKLIEEAKKRIIAEITGNLAPLKGRLADKLAPIVYDFVSEETRKWAAGDTDTTLGQFQSDVKAKFAQDTTTADHQRHAKVKAAVRAAILEFLNAEGPDSVRAKIVNVVNTLFTQHFPGAINERHIPKFVFDDNQWSKVVDEITNIKELGDITSGIDIESGFVTMFKVAASVVLIIPVLAVALIDALLDTSIADWLTKLLDRAFTKTYRKGDREEAYNKYVNDKDKIVDGIKQSLSSSVLTPEAEKQFGERIADVLSPVIDKAVDNVSLYF